MTRKIRVIVFFLLAVFLLNSPVIAAEGDEGQQSPADAQKEMEALMAPAMGQMMQGMMGAVFEVLSRPETAEKLASFTKNYYEALVKKGFTKEEALKIVTSMGVPSIGR